ncbi:acetyltransferase [Nonlabens marinus]|uniref:4-amino-6-deoxy-N-Acetyl-D-hexosaminyl-(Lipid carrier) acetyltrasferase n=1 Tax=Nonlabens marinus S1-08 TaxID=1454201 RepID=W8VWZ0_9FLAO|nr:acetyltransferase [Nonlabens marinus]BAO56743.1 4-amino-6-deoxy-N-Acetyl-D-hexosaminyl-(Lipid carrier) acetyltrasferase [Nonlabens marinus S1-08]
MNKELLIIGGSSTALEINEAVQLGYMDVYCAVTFVIGDNEKADASLNTIRDSEVSEYVSGKEVSYIISLTNHSLRLKIVEAMQREGLKAVNIIHPVALVSPTVKMGLGNYIAAGAIVSVNAKVANHCIINFDTIVGHDAILEDHVMINPGARISGHAHIGGRTLIGTNSIIYQGIKVGNDVLIDAMTYINRDIGSNMICSSTRQLKVLKRLKWN